MPTVMRSAVALVASFLAILIFNYLGTLTSRDKIQAILREANGANKLDQWINVDNDMFTECAMFDMTLVRDRSVLRDMVGTAVSMPASQHPCDSVRMHLAGLEDERSPIIRYFYGSRYLFAVLAAFLGVEGQRSAMGFLSIVASLALGVSFVFRRRAQALVISPLVLILLVGFSYSNLGRNIAHAPGFVFPLIGLAGLVACRPFFMPPKRRFAAYVVLAAVTGYFDILTGPLPFILATTVVVNHFCFNANDNNRAWIKEAAWICLLFVIVYVTIIGLKMTLAAIVFGTNPMSEYRSTLFQRVSLMVNDEPITRWQVFKQLWKSRGIPFFGVFHAAGLFYIAGAMSWITALTLVVIRRTAWRDVLVLAASSAIIVVWYLIFPNHTYVHHQFMGRIGVLPPIAGMMALIVVGKRGLLIAGLAVVPIVGLTVTAGHTMLFSSRLIEVTPVRNSVIDVTSCSNKLSLESDGKLDVVWRVAIEGPYAFKAKLLNLSVQRRNPSGYLTTEAGTFPLAVLSAEGRLLSARDRSLKIPVTGRTEILVAFCDDGANTPASRFSVLGKTSIGTISEVPVSSF